MKLLARIRSIDVDPSVLPGDYASYKSRMAGRAIIFDDHKVALIHVQKSGYYMLPGGGLDGENIEAGLAREVREELGCTIELVRSLGAAEVYFDRWRQKQTDHCFVAWKIGACAPAALTDFERDEGYQAIWAPTLQGAIALVEAAVPAALDGKMVRARDLLFLKAAARQAVS